MQPTRSEALDADRAARLAGTRLRRDGLVANRRDGKVVFASLTERGRALLDRVEAIGTV
jgi:DNA-binding transcriptional regulator PaaX